jgi:hypothetical protein
MNKNFFIYFLYKVKQKAFNNKLFSINNQLVIKLMLQQSVSLLTILTNILKKTEFLAFFMINLMNIKHTQAKPINDTV